MHNGIRKGITGIVLAAVLLLSEFSSIRSEAEPESGAETQTETKEETEEASEEPGSGTEAETESETETEPESGTVMESETGSGSVEEDETGDVEITVSGNDVLESVAGLSIDENEILENQAEIEVEKEGEWKGHSIQVRSYMLVSGEDVLESSLPTQFYLEDSLQGNQLRSGAEEGQDWAYALCSALESSLKMKNPDREAVIDRDALVSYLYSENKGDLIDKRYGDISGDLVFDPEAGSENAKKLGNVHTAMWAAASGYAVKNMAAPGQEYYLKNIYIFNTKERNKIKNAVQTQGEVVTSIYRCEDYFQRNSGSAEGSPLSYFCPEIADVQSKMEHAVTIVGWDDGYPYVSFRDPDGKLNESRNGAWLVKDAYGYDGEDKYWVSYYDAAFADGRKVNCYSFDIAEKKENAHTYQYDGGSSYFMSPNYMYAKAVNIFPKAGMHEVLNAISFGTCTREAQYEIQVYLDAEPAGEDNSQPVLEKPLFQIPVKTGQYDNYGYYTVDLSQYDDQFICEPRLSSLDEEEWFAVEITIVPSDGQQGKEQFWIDGGSYGDVLPKCRPDAAAGGQSYVWSDGKWVDFGKDIASGWRDGAGSNIRIKAHTQDRIALEAFSNEKVCREVWVGETLTLQAGIGGEPIDADNLEWTSDNPEIAEVLQDGTVVPNASGTVNITVTSKTYGSDTIGIVVKDVFYTERLSLCSNSINMEKRKGQIICTFYPSEYKPHHIEYKVRPEDSNYLWVDENGLITVREAAGAREEIPVLVEIYEDQEHFITKEVKVSCYQVPEKFEIVDEKQKIQDSVEIKIFEELQLGIRVIEPRNAVSSDIMWKSSNPAVVSVSPNGKLYAFKEGTAVITAASKDAPDNKKQVKVIAKTGVISVAFDESYISLLPNEAKTVSVKVLPGNIENQDIKWSMTDMEGNHLGLRNKSASFNPDTGILTAGNERMTVTKLKLYAECGGVKSSCFIKIDIPVQSLQLSFSEESIVTKQAVTTSVSAQELNPIMLYCHFRPEALSAEDVVLFYSSDNPEVAKVTKNGKIIPVKTGSVNLTAETEDGTGTEKIYLTIQSLYAGRRLSMHTDEKKLYVGGGTKPETTLVTVMTEDGVQAPAKDFYWRVSDESIAVVDDAGNVKAVSKGKVTVTATDKLDARKSVKTELQISVGVREIQAKRDNIEIAAGNKAAINYNILPLEADEKKVTLYAEDESIVWCYGKEIYALKEGVTAVYIEADNGIRKEIKVRVRKKEAYSIKAELTRGGTAAGYITTKGTKESQAQIKAEAFDESGNIEEISQIFEFYSENPDIAQVDDNGLVTGGDEGRTRIRVSTADGSKLKAYVTVIVQKADSGIKSVTLNHSKAELEKGEKLELAATLLPENASGTQEAAWYSMDDTIATVDSQGTVVARGYGKTYIVAQSMDGKKSASCEIKVLPMHSQIKLLKINDLVLESRSVNPSSQYRISVYANDGRDYRNYCEFASSNEKVCVVDETGLVVPAGQEAAGTSTITAKVKNDPLGRKVSFKVKLTDEKQAADIRIYANLSVGRNEISKDQPLYLPSETGREIRIEGFAVDRCGSYMGESSLKWSVSDKKVAVIRESGDGKINLTIKGKGSCNLICNVQKHPEISVSVPVYIYDRKPVLTVSHLSVNLLKTEDIILPVQTCVGTEIEELDVAYIKKGKKYWNGGFDIAAGSAPSGQYVLDYDSGYLDTGNYVIYAKAVIRCEDSIEGRMLKEIYHGRDKSIEIMEIPVKVTKQQPNVKIKQPTLNVFEKNAKQQLGIEAGEEIDRIELTDGKSIGVSEKFKVYKEEGNFWIYALTEEKGTFHAVLQVYFKNYTAPVLVKCAIKTVKNKPGLKALPGKLFVYKKEGETADFSLCIFNPSENEYISQKAGYEASSAADGQCRLENDKIKISGLDALGKKTIKILVKNKTLWNEEVLLNVPVMIEDESKIALETSQNKIILNKRLNGDCAEVSVYMKQQNIQISSIEAVDIYNADKKPSRDFDVAWDRTETGEMVIKFRAEDQCGKGKYQAEITAKAELTAADGSTYTKTYNKFITLAVEDVLPTVKVKLKGSIDLYNRTETYMTGTVAVSHTANKVVDITSERKDFNVIYDKETERFTLFLRQNYMISKKKQTVVLKIKLSDGTELKKAVNVYLKQSKVKWKKQDTVFLYKSAGRKNAVVSFETEKPEDADLRIVILSLPEGISVSIDHNQMSISVEDEGLKPGKYKIKTAIWILDADGLTPVDSAVVRKEIVIQIK